MILSIPTANGKQTQTTNNKRETTTNFPDLYNIPKHFPSALTCR
jgi:hypothetical protein